ncbi:MAG: hypothetical protein ACHQHN_01915 [Sphingobacteriales bacterium]
MKATIDKPIENVIQTMRQIREEVSNEIKDMSFAEERVFLDKLLDGGTSKIDPEDQRKRNLPS